MKRLIPLLVLVVTLATACRPFDSYAAIVNGEVIPVSVVDGELEAIKASGGYGQQLSSQLQATGGLQPAGDNTVNAGYAAQIVFVRVLSTLLGQELDRRNLEVSAEARAATAERVRSQNSPELFDQLDPRYRDYIVDTQAQLEVLQNSRNTPEEQRRYYEANRNQFNETCFRQVSAADENAANQLRARIAGGEDFVAVARAAAAAEAGPGSPPPNDPQIGATTCVTAAELSEFARGVLDPLQPGQITAPINSGGGFTLVQVVSRAQKTFEQSVEQVSARLTDPNGFIEELLRNAKIDVNPRFGRYQAPNPEQGQQGGIVPNQTNALSEGRIESVNEGGFPGGVPPGSP